MQLRELNQLKSEEAEQLLLSCCGSHQWAKSMAARIPFPNIETLLSEASGIWLSLNEKDFLQAFAAHPKIGDINALRNNYASTTQAEQGQVTLADENVLMALRELNQAYAEKFGFIFIVCATGKSAEEMLALLRARIDNERAAELNTAANEQEKITLIRLKKLLHIQ